MSRAEQYLYKRSERLSEEKVQLNVLIKETELEINETKNRIDELRDRVDESLAVFSPRTRKNDFIKNEITLFEKRADELQLQKDDYEEQVGELDEELMEIAAALEINTEEHTAYSKSENGDECEENNEIYNKDEKSDEIEDNQEDGENDGIEDNQEDGENDGIEDNQEDEENDEIEDDTPYNINGEQRDRLVCILTGMIHKCEMCLKIMDVDIVRSKMEIKEMSDILKKTIGGIEYDKKN